MDLANFPMVNQLSEPTSDHQPDENAQENCGPACLAAAIRWLTGNDAMNGDTLKDTAYGEGYTGMTSPWKLAPFLPRYGVTLQSVNGTPDALIGTITRELQAQHPVLLCIPSQWGLEPPAPPGVGYLHFVIAYGADLASVTCMNPWGGFAQRQPIWWWRERLRLGAVWPVAKVEVKTMAWTFLPDGTAHDSQGNTVGAGFAADIRQRGVTADAYFGETFVPNARTFKSFCPLRDGSVEVWDGQQVSNDAARVAAELWGLLRTATMTPATAPVTVGAPTTTEK